jgi:hypothetical protein
MAPLLMADSCGPVYPAIYFVNPKPQLGVTFEPLLIEVAFWTTLKDKPLRVLLNDIDITAEFEIGPNVSGTTYATAIDVWGAGLVLEGENELFARLGNSFARRTFVADGDPHADSVTSFAPGVGAGFGQSELPGIVTGGPAGLGLFQGGLDVLSLGAGGVIVLEFVDNVILDEPGVDFTVFENPFLTLVSGVVNDVFAEPGRVSVSQDGSVWFPFDACATAPLEPPLYPGCAGVFPTLSDPFDPTTPHPSIPTLTPISDLIGLTQQQIFIPEGSGGDSFDLADVGIGWARFVRIEDVGPALGQDGTIGFDLDAVTAVNAGVPTDSNGNGIPDAAE